MIEFFTGVPRSGKTLLAVSRLVEKYYKYDKESDSYELLPEYFVITNIDNLVLPHKNLDELIRNFDEKATDKYFDRVVAFKNFFVPEIMRDLRYEFGDKKFIFVIDECQFYFDRRFYDRDVFGYFQTHGHYKHNFILITQDIKFVPNEISRLSELEYRAVIKSFSFFGELKYSLWQQGVRVEWRVLANPKKYWSLYHSSDVHFRYKNPLFKWAAVLLVCVVFGGWQIKKLLSTPVLPGSGSPAPASASGRKGDSPAMARASVPAPAEEPVRMVTTPDGKKIIYKAASVGPDLPPNVRGIDHRDYRMVPVSYISIGNHFRFVDALTGELLMRSLLNYDVFHVGTQFYGKLSAAQYEIYLARIGRGERETVQHRADQTTRRVVTLDRGA